MSAKRRDKKKRVLRNGESQRKDGRYVYKYTDYSGKEQFVYSWTLEATDKAPEGKRPDLSLREKEAKIQKDLNDMISPIGAETTVIELVERYVSQKLAVRPNTRAGYQTMLNILRKEPFGYRKIETVRLSDAKKWLIHLQQDCGKHYSTIQHMRGVVRPAFQMAVDDDLIRKNPFDFQVHTVLVNDSAKREALTRKQERAFLEFIKNDKHFSMYYDAIYILFKTGMRISEFCGLTLADIDLERKTIRVDHQLQRTSEMKYVILPPKTESGSRIIPMADDVYGCFARIIRKRKRPKMEPMVDGKVGFLYIDKNGMPMVALHWEKYFKHIWEKYNKIYREQMPLVTPHVCRHTYCSNMAKSGMNPKTLQYLMGHSDLSVTMDVYTHVGFEDAKEELERLSANS